MGRHCHALPYESYDYRPLHLYNAATEHVGFLQTRQALRRGGQSFRLSVRGEIYFNSPRHSLAGLAASCASRRRASKISPLAGATRV